jgi:hypothetical protein
MNHGVPEEVPWNLEQTNRWYFTPQLLARKAAFHNALVVEAHLLFVVLALAGLLTVRALPHNMS